MTTEPTDTRTKLLAEIHDFVSAAGITTRQLGHAVAGDYRLIERLERRHSITIATMDKIRRHMASERERLGLTSPADEPRLCVILHFVPIDGVDAFLAGGWQVASDLRGTPHAVHGVLMRRNPRDGETWESLLAELEEARAA